MAPFAEPLVRTEETGAPPIKRLRGRSPRSRRPRSRGQSAPRTGWSRGVRASPTAPATSPCRAGPGAPGGAGGHGGRSVLV